MHSFGIKADLDPAHSEDEARHENTAKLAETDTTSPGRLLIRRVPDLHRVFGAAPAEAARTFADLSSDKAAALSVHISKAVAGGAPLQ